MMEKENYIVVNGVKYYPVYAKMHLTCFNCSLYDSNNRSCKLKNTGIKCEKDYIFAG